MPQSDIMSGSGEYSFCSESPPVGREQNSEQNRQGRREKYSPEMFLSFVLLLATASVSAPAYTYQEEEDFLLYPGSLEDSSEAEADPCPCRKDLRHWDKAFVMLEDSQMRQNMLLHSVDGILAGQLKGMRSEVRRGLADTAGACGLGRPRVADVASARLAKLVEQQHQGTVKWHQENAKKLQEVFLLLLGLHDRLGGLEDQLGMPEPGRAPPGEQGRCPTLTEELVQARAELSSLRARAASPPSETHIQEPPAGCRRTLTFPTPLKGQHAIILTADNHSLLAFTACIWAKPSNGANGTALFSYSTEGNHTQFQLYLASGWVQLSVGSTAVRGRAGPAERWTHYCGIWDGDSGSTTLVVDGQAVATCSPQSGPRTIPGRGEVRLGHRSGESHEGGDKAPTAFAGKLTGFNLWDSALTEVEVGRLLRGNGCDVKGNMVGWNISPVTEGTGVLFH